MTNQTPEQKARDEIDKMLVAAEWVVQSKNKVNLAVGKGVAVREYQTDVGQVDYVLFADGKPVGIIEAKREEEGEQLTTHEDQVSWYAQATLKYNLNKEVLRQSILKKAFAGQLLSEDELAACRRNPDWEPAHKLLERIKKSGNAKALSSKGKNRGK